MPGSIRRRRTKKTVGVDIPKTRSVEDIVADFHGVQNSAALRTERKRKRVTGKLN